MSIHIYTHVYTHVYTHIYTYLYTCLYTCLYTLIRGAPSVAATFVVLEVLVLVCMRDKKKLEDIKYECNMYCLQFAIRRTEKKKVSAQDHYNFMLCCFSLIKLKVKNEEDLFFIAPKRKKVICKNYLLINSLSDLFDK